MRSPSRQHLVAIAATLAIEHEKALTPDARIGVSNAVKALADSFHWMEGNFDRQKFTKAFEEYAFAWHNGNKAYVLLASIDGDAQSTNTASPRPALKKLPSVDIGGIPSTRPTGSSEL